MSAYRSAAPAPEATHTVLCRACGAVVRAGDDPDVPCGACGLLQPALRDDEVWSIAATDLVSHKLAGYHELDAFGASLGAPPSAMELTLRCDGVEIVASLHLDSGQITGLDFQVKTDGLPAIRLKRETDIDVDAKALGVSREVQTGDAAFDGMVYIESEASDADVLRVLSAPAVRRAIVCLVQEHATITIERYGIALYQSADNLGGFAPDRVNAVLAALRMLAGAPRPLAPSRAKVPGNHQAGVVVAPLGIGALMGAAQMFPPLDAEVLGGLGMIAGIFVAASIQPLLSCLMRGRSTSHRSGLTTRIASFVGIPPLLVAILVLVNGALDRSPEVEHHVVATSIHYDEENRHTTILADDERGFSVEVWVEDRSRQVSVGNAVTVWSRGGALGTRWRSRPSLITTEGGTLIAR